MKEKNYYTIATTIFTIVAALHFIRFIVGWEMVIGGWQVPMSLSMLTIALAVYMAWTGWQLVKKCR